jgi:hypothetical protein
MAPHLLLVCWKIMAFPASTHYDCWLIARLISYLFSTAVCDTLTQ